jgi:hypothetical protein
MGWRERIAHLLVGKGTGLTNDAYHGTKKVFTEFMPWNVRDAYTMDRALGTHAAKDPAMASEAFANGGRDYVHMTPEAYENIGEVPHVIPLKIPPDEAFLKAHQPSHAHPDRDEPPWRSIRTDTRAIDTMASEEAMMRDPDLLKAYLERNRAMHPAEARSVSRALVSGDLPIVGEKPRTLEEVLANYGAPQGDDLKQKVVDLARDSWQNKGYAGIKYINTAPMEAGAPGVKDVTSYLVFNPADLRSRFARFDPANIDSRDLLSGLAVGSVGTGAAVANWPPGEVAATDTYEARQ